MAVFEVWLKSDLQKAPLIVQPLRGDFFTGDNNGYRVGVEVLDGGAASTLSGTVTGYIIRGDGATVNVAGTLSGNKASVLIPASAMAAEGAITITIKLTSSGEVTTLGACKGNVRRSTTETILDPGTVITLVSSVNTVLPDGNGNVTLAASDITSGTFASGRIPNLNASKITAGTLGVDRLPVMAPASANDGGAKGAVPAPAAGDQNKVLKGNATWGTLSSSDVNAIARTGGEATGELTAPDLSVKATGESDIPRFWIRDSAGNNAISFLPVTAGGGRLRIRETTAPGNNDNYEDYRLPAPTKTDGGTSYDILTNKSLITVTQGGTGVNSVEAAQVALMGNNVYITAAGGPNVSDLDDLTVAGMWLTPGNTPHAPTADPYNVLVTNGTSRGTQIAWRSTTATTKTVYMRKWSDSLPGWGDWEIIAKPDPASMSDIYFAAGDEFGNSGNYVVPVAGYVASNGRGLYFTVPTVKSMANVSTVAITRLQGAIRVASGGCIANKTSSTYDWTTHTGVALAAVKAVNNMVRVYMNFEEAPANAVADTPVTAAFLFTFRFS